MDQMDLVDLLEEKQFLGQEFLTWLWFKSDERGGTIFVPDIGDVQVVFEKHMLLEYGKGDAHETLICQGLQTELKEARTGLAMGKKLEQARILLAKDNYEYHLTLKAGLFEFRSVKLPKTMAASEEGDDPAAVEGRLLDRIGLLEEAAGTVDELFRLFLKSRVSPDWDKEVAKMRTWINKTAL